MESLTETKDRARAIVKAASEIAKDVATKEWLERDERGKWEDFATYYLKSTAEKAIELGYDVETVNRNIAIKIVSDALDIRMRQAARDELNGRIHSGKRRK